MGFASGFQSGNALGQRIVDMYQANKEAELKQQIGQEAARYGVTEGAYGPELGQNIEQLRGLQAQDPGQAAAYGQAIQELERRQGLTAPDYSVGSRATNYATAEEARAAATPMRTQGLANVYRQAGDIEKADEVEARAFEMQRGLDQEARAKKLFETEQPLREMRLEAAQQQAEADTRFRGFEAWRAENPAADVAAVKDAAKAYRLNDDQVLKITANMAGLQENELKLWKGEVQNTIKGKTDEELVNLFNTDDRFDPTTNMERKVGKDGSITLTLKRQDGTVVSTYKAPDAATATAYLRKQALEPETLADWLLDRKKTEAAIAASDRSGRPSPRAPNYREYTNAAGQLVVVDMNVLPRDKDGQPVLPTGLSKAGSDKPVDVPEPDKLVKVNGRVMKTDGMGGYVAPDGIIPADRTNALEAAGVDENLINQLNWAPDGLTVGFGGKEYDPRNPRDIRELNADYRRLGANTIAVEEAQRNTPRQPRVGLQPTAAPVLSIPAGGGRPVVQGMNPRGY